MINMKCDYGGYYVAPRQDDDDDGDGAYYEVDFALAASAVALGVVLSEWLLSVLRPSFFLSWLWWPLLNEMRKCDFDDVLAVLRQ